MMHTKVKVAQVRKNDVNESQIRELAEQLDEMRLEIRDAIPHIRSRNCPLPLAWPHRLPRLCYPFFRVPKEPLSEIWTNNCNSLQAHRWLYWGFLGRKVQDLLRNRLSNELERSGNQVNFFELENEESWETKRFVWQWTGDSERHLWHPTFQGIRVLGSKRASF